MTKSILLAAALSAVFLAGCGGPSAARPDADTPASTKADAGVEGVQARAQHRWDLLVAGKAAEAWEYFSPGYREIKTRDEYAAEIAVRPVKWTKVEVTGSQCPAGEQICDVEVDVYFSMDSSLPGVGKLESHSPLLERWIETDGNWYFVPKEVARN